MGRFKQNPLESTIESATVRFAETRCGLFSRKLNGIGNRSWPDRMFLGLLGRLFFIEFKRKGKLPTPAQAHLHKKLRAYGFRVHLVDSVLEGKRVILEESKASRQKQADLLLKGLGIPPG